MHGGSEYNTPVAEQKELHEIERKIYQYIPIPILPKSLTKEHTKEVMIDANTRAKNIY